MTEEAAALPPGLLERLAEVRSVGVITGAGVSAESGIPTYRGTGGLYDDPEEGDRTIEALSGCFSLGSITTVFPRAIAGAINETKVSNGCSSGQAIPSTPIGSLTATVIPRSVVSCTVPPYLSAQAA